MVVHTNARVAIRAMADRPARHRIPLRCLGAASAASGGAPDVPRAFQHLLGPRVFHSSEYLVRIPPSDELAGSTVAVIGSGQSAAEVIHHLLGNGSDANLIWVIRDFALRPMDDSQFVNEVFFPGTIDFTYDLTNRLTGSVITTSSGDALVTAADAWVAVASPLGGDTLVAGPQVTVLGTPSTPERPFSGAMTFAGNWLHDTFNNPLVYSGHEGNFQAYVNTLTLAPRTTRSLLHFVVLGPRVTAATSAEVRASVEATASRLAETPETSGLTSAEICSIANFDVAAITSSGFDYASCAKARRIAQAPAPTPVKPITASPYDVVGKTIAQLRADMEAGITTSQQITRAYLDRIAVYDRGQFGFNAYEYVARDAMAQARAADAARAAG